MSQSVTIKSNKYGINLVLDPEIGFDELLKGCCRKVQSQSSTLFLKMQNWHCPLKEENFRKRKNSRSSQQLKATHRLEILCIVENGTRQEAVMK